MSANSLKIKHLIFLYLFFGLNWSNLLSAQTAQHFYELANQKRARSEYQLAIINYTEAIRLNPKFAEAYAERGDCHSRQRADALALPDYNQAIQLGLNDNLVFLNRGWAYYNLGQVANACLDWQMAEQLGYPKLTETLKKHCY
jgi:tetratricopeptide (TPR) repeat protein